MKIMRSVFLFLLISCGFIFAETGYAMSSDPREIRTTVSMNQGWKFVYGDSLQADEEKWIDVNVPHDFQIHQSWVMPSPDERPDDDNPMANIRSRLSSRGFKEMGAGWYRKSFVPDSAWLGRRVLIDFEGILLVGDVYLNGKYIGGTDYGYLGFESDITDSLIYGASNLIEVRADTGKPENSRWYTGAGIYRDVNIVVTDMDHYFCRHPLKITTPVVGKDVSAVVIDAEITTRHRLDSINVGVRIFDRNGNAVYDRLKRLWNNPRQSVREFRIDSVAISNAELWDCDNPCLYTVELSLYGPDCTPVDRVSERTILEPSLQSSNSHHIVSSLSRRVARL